jgi:SAGA-associated factor 73
LADEGGKKRKVDDEEVDDPKKKSKVAKVTKGRFKGPIDYDKHCGVINDKGLPCSRSLTCKSHAMGAKRAVQGRSKDYDILLLEWNRLNNPNFVEPVKRETKAEKKEKKEREKAEKKRLAAEAQQAAAAAKAAAGGTTKKSKKQSSSTNANNNTPNAPAAASQLNAEEDENLDDVDSEAELDAMVHVVRTATANGLLGLPLAVPYDTGTWFVARRERLRNCRDSLLGALKAKPYVGGIKTANSMGGGTTSVPVTPVTPVKSSGTPMPPSAMPPPVVTAVPTTKITGT